MDIQPVTATEHTDIHFSDKHNKLKEWLRSENLPNNKKEILGLYPRGGEFRPGNFIGAVWIGKGENKTPLIVYSKFPKMNYLSMYLECAEDPNIKNHIRGCFNFWSDKPLIKADKFQKLSELLIAVFLKELNELCLRHLRKHFERETANLTGKMKGKILIHRHVKRNFAHGREDKVFCSYQTIKQDIPENRVLRAALEQSAKFINARAKIMSPDNLNLLGRWVHSCRAALSGVPSMEVKKSDFLNLRVRGAFAHYRRSIELAKFVLLQMGTNPRAKFQNSTATPPFAINSAELFERFTEKILRQEKYSKLKPGHKIYGDNTGFDIPVIPDFFVPIDSERPTAIIIDAKYKEATQEQVDISQIDQNDIYKMARDDVYQMVAYSRHKNLLEELGCKDDRNLQLILVYPNTEHDQEDDIEEKKTDNSFEVPLSMHFIKCPTTVSKLR